MPASQPLPSASLTDRQRKALRAICDAFVPAIDRDADPSGYWGRSASDLGVPDAIERLLGDLPLAEVTDLRRLLDLLSTPLAGLTWRGRMRPVFDLSPTEREEMLRRWSRHFLPQVRRAYSSLKKLCGMLAYGLTDESGRNPNWADIGYPGPPFDEMHGASGRLNVLIPDRDLEYRCDTVVVGSGAGGGVCAGVLSEAGHEVIVVEKGPYVDPGQYDGIELRAMERLYERRGALVTSNGSTTVLAGSCVGGGTTVNWAGSFRIPKWLRHEWARDHLNPHFVGSELDASFDAVEEALSVDTDQVALDPQNRIFERGCRALAYAVNAIPTNVRTPADEAEWKALGFSPFGDRFGTKRGMAETYLARASDHGARLLTDATVERVLIENGRAIGVEATHQGAGGRRVSVTIRAHRVIVAAGAIHSPALLLRSGIEHPHLGRHLYLHPTVPVAARYDEVVDAWHGPMMMRVCDEFANLDGGFGFRLETPPIHPGILGLALPWKGGEAHKRAMLSAREIAAFIVLTRDRDGGRVVPSRCGSPVLHYALGRYDREHVLRGIEEAVRVHQAAGAREVHIPHNTGPILDHTVGDDRALEQVRTLTWGPNRFTLFSAHQMGTCRMGGRKADHPVGPNGAVRGVPGLYVADASVFPSSSGVNPVLTIQALAHLTARGIAAEGSGTRKALYHETH